MRHVQRRKTHAPKPTQHAKTLSTRTKNKSKRHTRKTWNMSCQNKIAKPVKNPTLKTCARIFWCGMRLCPFLDLEGVPGCSTMQMEINLHCRRPHFSGNWNCHTGPRTCARIFWCGMGLPLFLDLVAWRSKMQILIQLALLTLPSFFWQLEFQTTVPVPESSGVECVVFCFWIWMAGPQNVTGNQLMLSMLPLFLATGIVTRDHCVCVRIFWCEMRLRLFLGLGPCVPKFQWQSNLSWCILSGNWTCHTQPTTLLVLESSGLECVFVCFWFWWPNV